ncbi:hypothetical protein QBC35DRAFT_444256 [Podospora australis]|uniref:Kelch repeat protein n=1 Tax=Podospora australis TaxID=1536484 RepID=A0AAN6WJJ2_9PEZI|nr:hypothetical protein QBC35DRAFT_444256 [Podospora australis]
MLGQCLVLGAFADGTSHADVPSPERFLRRSLMRATLLGNHVYIEGGVGSQLRDSKEISNATKSSGDEDTLLRHVLNSTISIDMFEGWSAGSVEMKTIPKPAGIPIKCNSAIWTNAERSEFYIWGGLWLRGENIMDKTQLYKFCADGHGGGAWCVETGNIPKGLVDSIEEGSTDIHTVNLISTEQMAFASTPDTSFSLGGWASGYTELGRMVPQTVPGVMDFNMKTKAYKNATFWGRRSPYVGGWGVSGAMAHFVPGFGSNGMVIMLGGYVAPVTEHRLEDEWLQSPEREISFREVSLFDPVTMEAHVQSSTGDIPKGPRKAFCVAGIESKKGKQYGIFVMGGNHASTGLTFQDAYVLSLPGFVWTRLPTPPGGRRAWHTCLAVGKRQILVIGGGVSRIPSRGYVEDTPDILPQGLMLFDMATWVWKHDYSSLDEPYESAEVIQSWYRNGSLAKVQWSSDKVRDIFVTSASATLSPEPTLRISEDTLSNNTPPLPRPVVIASIVGGISGVCLACILAYALVQRRKKRKSQMPGQSASFDEVEKSCGELVGEGPDFQRELPSHHRYVPSPNHEISSSGHGYNELP